MARSSTLIFTIIFCRLFLGQPITLSVVISCVLIIFGFIVSVDQEMLISSLSLTGVLYGILASMFAALSGIYIKRADKLVNGNALEISLTMNLEGIVFLLPIVLSTGQFHFALQSSKFEESNVWWMVGVTGVLSLLVGWASNKVIGLTSPLTHNMSINAKSLLQTVIAVAVQGDSKNAAWWFGNLFVVLGLVSYGVSNQQRQKITKDFEIKVRKTSECDDSFVVKDSVHDKFHRMMSV